MIHDGPIRIAAASALVAAGLALASPADACSFSIAEAQDDQVATLAAADKALDDGDPREAYALVVKAIGDVRAVAVGDPDRERGPRIDRALRIAALAILRTDGEVDAARAPGVTWARATLAEIAENAELPDKSDPGRLRGSPLHATDLAEARELTEPDEARATLEKLARSDLVATASGYGTLARLRAAAGDPRGADEARLQCLKMATAASLCDPPRADRSATRRLALAASDHWKLGLLLGALGAVLGARRKVGQSAALNARGRR